MFEHFHFLNPQWFLALLPLLVLLWVLFRNSSEGGDSPWRQLVDKGLLPHMTDQTEKGITSKLPLWLLSLGWLITVLAMAGPSWERVPQPVYQPPEARVIVLSLNQSMLAQDIRPSRLEQARLKITDLLRRTRGEQTGLIVYASDAFTVTPLTDDINTLLSQLRVLQPDLMPVSGDQPENGIALAGELLSQAGRSEGDIILFTDSHGSVATRNEAKRLHNTGYRVSVFGFGTASGAPVPTQQGQAGKTKLSKLNAAALRDIADAGGGNYLGWQAGGGDLDRLLEITGHSKLGDSTLSVDRKAERWLNRGPWLVVLLLPLAALAFRRGWLLLVVLVVGPIMQPTTLHAADWNDLWERSDQQAHKALQAGDYDRAVEVAEQPERRGEALYRQGDFAAAAEQFALGEGADAQYNKANALARSGKLEEAIQAYDQALAENPDMDDATFNRKLVEDLLQQQEQEQQEQEQQDQENQQDQQQDQQQSSDSKQDEQNKAEDSKSQDGESGESESSTEDQKSDEKSDATEQEKEQQSKAEDSANQNEQQENTAEDNTELQSSDFSEAGDEQQQQQANQAVSEARSEEQEAEAQQQQNVTMNEDHLSPEERQQVENYLRRVPDDPGALLRRKFLYQYKQRAQENSN